MGVHPPAQGRQPGEPAFDQRDTQVREPLEDALTQVCAGVEWAGLVD